MHGIQASIHATLYCESDAGIVIWSTKGWLGNQHIRSFVAHDLEVGISFGAVLSFCSVCRLYSYDDIEDLYDVYRGEI
jgi:hypothetical protein